MFRVIFSPLLGDQVIPFKESKQFTTYTDNELDWSNDDLDLPWLDELLLLLDTEEYFFIDMWSKSSEKDTRAVGGSCMKSPTKTTLIPPKFLVLFFICCRRKLTIASVAGSTFEILSMINRLNVEDCSFNWIWLSWSVVKGLTFFSVAFWNDWIWNREQSGWPSIATAVIPLYAEVMIDPVLKSSSLYLRIVQIMNVFPVPGSPVNKPRNYW